MPQPVAERRLGTWPIFVIAVSAMTPLTVVAGALPLGYGQVEEKGIPVAYMLVAAVLGVFAVGLAAMARHVPNSGAFYAYAAAGLSRPAGVGTAFVALLAYNAMQIGLYGAFGVAAHNAMAIFGIEVSWVIWALLGWALIAVLGRLNIDLNARILTVLVCAEVLIVLVFDAVMLGNPAGGSVSFDTLDPTLIASAGGVALLVAAVAGMVGFEAPLVYAAEARDPRRTVARAIALTLLVAAVLYGGTAWVMSVVAGPDQIVAIAGDHLDDLFFFLPDPYLPEVIIDLGRIFFATSLFAAMLAFHHTVARYVLTVAREGVLPPSLARTRDGVPVTASFAQSSLALAVLLLFGLVGWNPTTDLFFFGTVSGGLGVLVLMVIASIAVVRYFRRGDHGETRWRRSIAPWISAIFIALILLLTVASFGILLDSDNPLKVYAPPLAFLALFLVGVRWGRRLRRRRPDVYSVIGTGQPPSMAGNRTGQRPWEAPIGVGRPPAESASGAEVPGDNASDEGARHAQSGDVARGVSAATGGNAAATGGPAVEGAAAGQIADFTETPSRNGGVPVPGSGPSRRRVPQARSAPDAAIGDVAQENGSRGGSAGDAVLPGADGFRGGSAGDAVLPGADGSRGGSAGDAVLPGSQSAGGAGDGASPARVPADGSPTGEASPREASDEARAASGQAAAASEQGRATSNGAAGRAEEVRQTPDEARRAPDDSTGAEPPRRTAGYEAAKVPADEPGGGAGASRSAAVRTPRQRTPQSRRPDPPETGRTES